MAIWRNGSASDSRSDVWEFESLWSFAILLRNTSVHLIVFAHDILVLAK